jgi:hypothetical protein
MRYRCTACPNNCTPPGKLRGFKLRDHACPCGGTLARGTNADGPWAHAVPLTLEQRVAVEERGLKRSSGHPRLRGAARLELLALLAFASPVIVLLLAIGAEAFRKWRPWPTKDLGHRQGCQCASCHRDERAA